MDLYQGLWEISRSWTTFLSGMGLEASAFIPLCFHFGDFYWIVLASKLLIAISTEVHENFHLLPLHFNYFHLTSENPIRTPFDFQKFHFDPYNFYQGIVQAEWMFWKSSESLVEASTYVRNMRNTA